MAVAAGASHTVLLHADGIVSRLASFRRASPPTPATGFVERAFGFFQGSCSAVSKPKFAIQSFFRHVFKIYKAFGISFQTFDVFRELLDSLLQKLAGFAELQQTYQFFLYLVFFTSFHACETMSTPALLVDSEFPAFFEELRKRCGLL